MTILATTTVTVLRGTATSEFGDEIDIDEVIASEIPASILEQPVRGGRPASGRRDTPRTYTLRTYRRVELQQNDRIRDERTGRTYYVTTEAPSTNPVGLGSVRVDLQRVS